MTSRLDGETQDERAMLIDVAKRECVGPQWQELLGLALDRMDPWLPWLVLCDDGESAGAHGFLAKPSPFDRALVQRSYGGRSRAVIVDLVRGLRRFSEESAAAACRREARYPMVDEGPADWLE